MTQSSGSYRWGALLLVLAMLSLPGCCTRKAVDRRKASSERSSEKSPATVTRTVAAPTAADGEVMVSGNETARILRPQDRKTKEQYRRLEYAFDMYNSQNYDGSLREVERLQLEIDNDPYLEMQSWYLSAMIYHKTDKSSRRKRAMRKMLESMEQLQKDPRFRNAYEDGMIGQELVGMAVKKGEGRYAE